MKFVADLHLHSKYSRAVSQHMELAKMAQWAKYKGINVLATGDFTHPFWFDQLKKELEEVGNGLLRLKSTNDSKQLTTDKGLANSSTPGVKTLYTPSVSLGKSDVYFLLSCEISSIYSQGGKLRRIHNLFFFPKISSVEKFNRELLKRGANLRADGRPIVGVTSRDLAKIALDCDEKALVIPAHAWTPWFSVFGSFSGFDSIEECFGDMAKYIYGIETGLSSDPAMNWQIKDLDKRSILSFSDAHSLEKMGREATVFEGNEVSYDCIYDAIVDVSKVAKGTKESNGKNTSSTFDTSETFVPSKIAFTVEFYPEEGKYHYTGHRTCNFRQSPEETKKDSDICPVCKRKLTVGVMHRVEELATRDKEQVTREVGGVRWVYPKGDGRPPYVSLVPLSEILAESLGVATGTKKVLDQYMVLIDAIGSELAVLIKTSLDKIGRTAPARVVDGIGRVRSGNIFIDPGYDGVYGKVQIWQEDGQVAKDQSTQQVENREKQLNLFA